MSVPVDVLAGCPLFAAIPPAHLTDLAARCRERAFVKGASIFREGDPVTGFFVVLTGSVRIFKIAADGRERTLHLMYPPHAFAEAAVFETQGFPAYATAMTATRLIHVPREPFLAMLEQRPGAARLVIQSLSQWMHRLLDQLEAEAFLNARARVATWLLRELERQPAGRDRQIVALGSSRKELALQLGVAAETFSRLQTEFEERGMIRASRRHIEILDRDALRDAILHG